MTNRTKESLDNLFMLDCPHRMKIGGLYMCLIHDAPCQYILDKELHCSAKNNNKEGEE